MTPNFYVVMFMYKFSYYFSVSDKEIRGEWTEETSYILIW